MILALPLRGEQMQSSLPHRGLSAWHTLYIARTWSSLHVQLCLEAALKGKVGDMTSRGHGMEIKVW